MYLGRVKVRNAVSQIEKQSLKKEREKRKVKTKKQTDKHGLHVSV